MLRAALRVGGVVASGRSHADAMGGLTDGQLDDPGLESGWVDDGGRFYADATEALAGRLLAVVRHAESRRNAGLDDDDDARLTRAGADSAARLGRHLAHMSLGLTVGLVSPFLRCLQTAAQIARLAGVRFRVEPLLGEHGAFGPVVVRSRRDEFPEFDWPACEAFEFAALRDAAELGRAGRAAVECLPEAAVVVTHGPQAAEIVHRTAGPLDRWPLVEVPNASLTVVRGAAAECLFHRAW